jgi:hypothetical protein
VSIAPAVHQMDCVSDRADKASSSCWQAACTSLPQAVNDSVITTVGVCFCLQRAGTWRDYSTGRCTNTFCMPVPEAWVPASREVRTSAAVPSATGVAVLTRAERDAERTVKQSPELLLL